MKTLTKTVLLLSCFTFLNNTGWAAEPLNNPVENKPLHLRAVTDHLVIGWREFVNTKALEPYAARANCVGDMETQTLEDLLYSAKQYYFCMMHNRCFSEALLIADGIYEKREHGENLSPYNTGRGESLDITPIIENCKNFVKVQTPLEFSNFLQLGKFLEASELNRAYFKIPVKKRLPIDGSDTWLVRIRERAAANVELHAQKSKALENYPEFAQSEIEQAMQVIHTFANGDPLRSHLIE